MPYFSTFKNNPDPLHLCGQPLLCYPAQASGVYLINLSPQVNSFTAGEGLPPDSHPTFWGPHPTHPETPHLGATFSGLYVDNLGPPHIWENPT